jgi:hypothetical protein
METTILMTNKHKQRCSLGIWEMQIAPHGYLYRFKGMTKTNPSQNKAKAKQTNKQANKLTLE